MFVWNVRFWCFFTVVGAGEASADVPGEDEADGEGPADGAESLTNGKVSASDGTAPPTRAMAAVDINSEEVKKKRKRNRGGKGNKQTDPPTVAITKLFPDG